MYDGFSTSKLDISPGTHVSRAHVPTPVQIQKVADSCSCHFHTTLLYKRTYLPGSRYFSISEGEKLKMTGRPHGADFWPPMCQLTWLGKQLTPGFSISMEGRCSAVRPWKGNWPRSSLHVLSSNWSSTVTLARTLCSTCDGSSVQSYPGYPNAFRQRGFIGCSDKRNCSDNPNETFLDIYILL